MGDSQSKMQSVWDSVTKAASTAADTVSDAAHSAKQVVGDRYNAFKLNSEIERQHQHLRDIFAEIGQLMYGVHTGALSSENDPTPQQQVDVLLADADAVQTALAGLQQQQDALNGIRNCPVCSYKAAPGEVFCSQCGASLGV